VNGHPAELARHERWPVGAALAAGILDHLAECCEHERIREPGQPKLHTRFTDDVVELASRYVRPAA